MEQRRADDIDRVLVVVEAVEDSQRDIWTLMSPFWLCESRHRLTVARSLSDLTTCYAAT